MTEKRIGLFVGFLCTITAFALGIFVGFNIIEQKLPPTAKKISDWKYQCKLDGGTVYINKETGTAFCKGKIEVKFD